MPGGIQAQYPGMYPLMGTYRASQAKLRLHTVWN